MKSNNRKLLQKDLAIALGVSDMRVSTLKKRGMPVDSVKSAKAWMAANLSVSRVVGQGRTPVQPEPESTPTAPILPIVEPDSDGPVPDFNESRARREAADARMSELKVKEKEGTLIEKAAVEASLARQFGAIRDGLLQFPARLAPAVAHETDIGKIQNLLDRELRQILGQMVGVSA